MSISPRRHNGKTTVLSPLPSNAEGDKNEGRELSLMVDATNMCQLDCRYCYYGKKGDRLMDVERVFRGIKNFVPTQEGVARITVHYMGGEPLLAWPEILKLNQRVRQFCDQREFGFRWGLTSNLIALDEAKAEVMIREKAGIHCSIDGPAHIHNRNRPYCGGQPSFDDVVKGVPLALQITPHDTARVTVCPDGTNELPLIAETLLGLGFTNVGLFPVYNEHWTMTAIEQWAKGIEQTFKQHPQKISTVVKRRNRNEQFTFCGAGKGLWAFDVNGQLYHCHHFTNLPHLTIIDATQTTPAQILEAINLSTMPPKPLIPEKCQLCSALDFCSGGCWADSFLANGDTNQLEKTECQLRVTTAMALKDFFPEEKIEIRACSYCYSCESCQSEDTSKRNERRCSDKCERYCQYCQSCYSCQARCEFCQANCQNNRCEDCKGMCDNYYA